MNTEYGIAHVGFVCVQRRVPTCLRVEYAERRKIFNIIFNFSLFLNILEYVHIQFGRDTSTVEHFF